MPSAPWNPEYYQRIQGWFDFAEVYDRAVQQAAPEANFVEIGAWRGRSTCYLASRIKMSAKKINLWVVDTWKGSTGTYAEQLMKQALAANDGDLFPEFLENMRQGGVVDLVQPLQMRSIEAAPRLVDGSLDFIFVDGAHDYEAVEQDLMPGGQN
jgi:predicted O-methyltransferase YrrM